MRRIMDHPTPSAAWRSDAYTARSEGALERALFRTRAYAAWRTRDPGAAAGVEARYAALPASDKRLLRAAHPDGLVPSGMDLAAGLARGAVEWVATSGTTDEQVVNLWNQRWWNASERASWQFNAHAARLCTGRHREAILTSARSVGVLGTRTVPYARRRLGRFLFLNEHATCATWTAATIRRMARELARFHPVVLEANPSYLARFADLATRLGLTVPQPGLIVFTYENPTRVHLRRIRRAFAGVPMLSSYGSTEIGYAFVQCEAGCLHLNHAACRTDFVPWPGADPDVGTLRVTPFGNEWTALLRFDPGDLVRRSRHTACACGREGPLLLEGIEGRVKSLTHTPAGRPVTPAMLDACVAQEPALTTYQLVQESPRDYLLRAVLEESAPSRAAARLADLLHDLYGPAARPRVEITNDIPAEPSGKFLMAKKCELENVSA